MTSALPYINKINVNYPTSGVLNNAQGFRDNFGNIKQALASLDSYMNALASPPSNINAPSVTATTIVASQTLQLGANNFITVGSSNETKVQGVNPNGTAAVGSIAFFPNVIPIAVKSISSSSHSITTFNTTTNILPGASFTPVNTTTVYTVTGVDGYTIYVSPDPGFDDVGINITNPIFQDYTVINASTVSNLISSAFAGIVTLTDGHDSTSTTSGALQVQGGMGVSGNVYVNSNTNITGDVNLVGNYTSNSANTVLNGLMVAGNLTLADSNNDASPTLVLNVNSWDSSFNANGGYQVFPGGMIWMWGVSSYIPFDSQGGVVFPTLPGYSTPGFPNACVNAQTVVQNSAATTNYAMMSQIVSISAQGLTLINNKTHNGANGGSSVIWFATGY